jgi:hypothetical protein
VKIVNFNGQTKTLVRSEFYEQASLCRWMTLRKMTYLHVPNELIAMWGRRTLAKQKRSGFAAGAPDLLIFDVPPNKAFRGVAIEMKSKKGKLSPAQEQWLTKLEMNGWTTKCAYSFEEARDYLISLGF